MKSTSVKCEEKDGRLWVECPYCDEIVREFRKSGGAWNGSLWHFDLRDRAKIETALRAVFGTAGEDVPLCDVLVPLAEVFTPDEQREQSLSLFGRLLARRSNRDAAVSLGRGVVIAAGEFASEAGSARYPRLGDVAGVVLELRDVPVALVNAWHADESKARLRVIRIHGNHPDADLRADLEAKIAALRAALQSLAASAGDDLNKRDIASDSLESLREIETAVCDLY